MFANFARLFLVACCFLAVPASAKTEDKLSVLLRVNSVHAKLLDIAAERKSQRRRGVQQFSDRDIARLIRKQHSLEVLARLSASSRAYMHPGRAEDKLVDNVLDEAWRKCLQRIEQIGGKAAMATLQEMALEQRLDGAYSLMHRATLERLGAKEAGRTSKTAGQGPQK